MRGTWWLVADLCQGTLTRVKEGVVEVQDFVAGRRKLLRAGQSYLAKAPAKKGAKPKRPKKSSKKR